MLKRGLVPFATVHVCVYFLGTGILSLHIGSLIGIVGIIIYGMMYVSFIVSCHRLVQLGPAGISHPFGVSFSRREGVIVGCWIGIALIQFAIGLLVILVEYIVGIIGFGIGDVGKAIVGWAGTIVISIVIFRLFLSFPLVAAGEENAFDGAWRLTGGHWFRFLCLLGVFMMPVLAIGWTVDIASASLFIALSPSVLAAFVVTHYFLVAAVLATVLSVSYLELQQLLPNWRELNAKDLEKTSKFLRRMPEQQDEGS
jgi:hypothetical protein